jgi:hypothetical protein
MTKRKAILEPEIKNCTCKPKDMKYLSHSHDGKPIYYCPKHELSRKVEIPITEVKQ